MNIRMRTIWVGLMVPLAVAMAVGTSSATTQPPARPFKAHYRGSFAVLSTPATSWQRQGPVASAKPGPAIGQELQVSGQGWAMSLGPSRLAGSLRMGDGRPCQSISGSVVLSSTGPTDTIPVSVRLSLTGVACTPLEGTAIALSGTYRAIGSTLGPSSGNGQFAGRAYGSAGGRLVLYFTGSL
jgi:hypothetical protein